MAALEDLDVRFAGGRIGAGILWSALRWAGEDRDAVEDDAFKDKGTVWGLLFKRDMYHVAIKHCIHVLEIESL